MNQIKNEVQGELAIELDENGMVVVNDPELLKLVSGGLPGKPGGTVGVNDGCSFKAE